MKYLIARRVPNRVARRLPAFLLSVTAASSAAAVAPAPTPVALSQLPLTIATPAHPQILFALANSESSGGILGGARMIGSGALGSGVAYLQNTSSPVNYTVPSGFTPPVNPGSGGIAPYTVAVGANLIDNSASRLNTAKAGIAAILNQYMPSADFALADYSTSSLALYTTWVYDMSPSGGFVFTNTEVAGDRYVANPCNGYPGLGAGNQIYQDCQALAVSGLVHGNVGNSAYMQISASSDDPLINSVLKSYPSSFDPIAMNYDGPTPANPYTAYGLATYNQGTQYILENYSAGIEAGPESFTPTNAGYVVYSPQVLFFERGFGFLSYPSATTANVLVPMTSAGQLPTSASIAAAVAPFTHSWPHRPTR